MLLIIEVKTRLDDLAPSSASWAGMSAPRWVLPGTWDGDRVDVASWLIVLASDEVDVAIATNRDALAAAFPMRAVVMSGVVSGRIVPDASSRGIAMVDPSSRRREWLIRSRSDGRRSQAPYRGYADAARRFGP